MCGDSILRLRACRPRARAAACYLDRSDRCDVDGRVGRRLGLHANCGGVGNWILVLHVALGVAFEVDADLVHQTKMLSRRWQRQPI